MKIEYKALKGSQDFFAEELNLLKLEEFRDPLDLLTRVIDFEMFRPLLEEYCVNKEKLSHAGAKPYDVVFMFKILIIKELYNLSYLETRFHIVDRTSFRKFLGNISTDDVPHENSIRHFFEKLVKNGVSEKLFELFYHSLTDKGIIANKGRIVDASFVEVPIQRNRREENQAIKENKELWQDKPHKKAQKDTDARWGCKGDKKYYGYKLNIKSCNYSKMIISSIVTDASVHDSKVLSDLLDESDSHQPLYADKAYVGEEIENLLKELNIQNEILEKGARNKPLTEAQKLSNRMKSKIRARVEHIFAVLENLVGGMYKRLIGKKRIREELNLCCLIHNMVRYEQIVRLNLLPING